VIGGGIAGLTTGYLLAREGRRVVILEDRDIASGQSAKTSAHLSSAFDDLFSRLERTRGLEISRVAAESHSAAITRIETIARGEGIDCHFERIDGYLFAASDNDADLIQAELEATHRAGLEDTTRLEAVPLSPAAPGPCIRYPRQARFHPLRYLRGLAEAFRRLGGELVIGVRVLDVEGGERVWVHTGRGYSVSADAVVVATNSPFNDRFAIHTKQAPYLSYCIAAPISRDSVPDALYWDTADPYHYVRLAREDHETFLIVGGEDHKTGQATDQEARFGRLEDWARRLVPQIGPVRYRWSGQVLETVDGLGFIGRNPADSSNVFIATGDSGMGLTHGTIAGILLTDLIQGRNNPWASAYDPSRKPIGGVKEFLKENINVATQYLGWLTGGDVSCIADIPPGRGAVVRRGASKIAVYRAFDGHIQAFSAVCPHLGCIVAWNSASNSWDCPCHGSRFDCDGRVLQGPSTKGLTPVAHLEQDDHGPQPVSESRRSDELRRQAVSEAQKQDSESTMTSEDKEAADEIVLEASEESFPASDPPAWIAHPRE
jgi:glycine/D-amino acid oxidase-like deaminating enzyme/nitrite reductase/ring-hydroxylating ferredoxin subunit